MQRLIGPPRQYLFPLANELARVWRSEPRLEDPTLRLFD
mgnify:CR=1 FL=1